MIFKGFKFGMLLQFAIGPVCIFIFQTGSEKGFYITETGVLGVTLIDGIYILAAILGIASILERKNIKLGLKIFGACILFAFGASMVLNQFNITLPSLNIQNSSNTNNVFFRAILLTISNPLTIMFWAGVFSTRILEENMSKKDIYLYGFGTLMSTAFFLTIIACAGSLTKTFLPTYVIAYLNIIVGFLLIYFSIRMFFKKTQVGIKK